MSRGCKDRRRGEAGADGGQTCACGRTLAGGDARAGRSGRHPRDPLVQLVDGRGIGGVLDLAPVRQRRRNGGYSDLPVAAIEIWLLAAGVFTGFAAHCSWSFCAPWELLISPVRLLARVRGSLRWRASAAEMRNKSCPIVTFQPERQGDLRLIAIGVQRPLVCPYPRRASGMVNLKLRYCALDFALRDGVIPGRRKGNFPWRGSKLRHSCNRFR